MIGHVLDMTAAELSELGSEASGKGWLGGIWSRSKTPPSTPRKAASASAFNKVSYFMQIQFTRKESKEFMCLA